MKKIRSTIADLLVFNGKPTKDMIESKKQIMIKAFTGNQDADQLSTKVFKS